MDNLTRSLHDILCLMIPKKMDNNMDSNDVVDDDVDTNDINQILSMSHIFSSHEVGM